MKEMPFDKIDQTTVVSHVVSQISNLIINKEVLPGARIPTESELSERLGVGRNSIREAIKTLIAVGVLEIQRGKGTYVATKVGPSIIDPLIFSLIIDPNSAKDLYEFRVMFESMLLFSSSGNLSEQQISQLTAIVEEAKKSYKQKLDVPISYYVELDVRFHNTLLHMNDNPLIKRLGNTLMQFIPQYIDRSIRQKNGIERSIENHERIIHALKGERKDAIISIIEETLKEWKQEWKEFEES
jgi:GntR family transcriptional repressor for pyruvate dehydrogenase complex